MSVARQIRTLPVAQRPTAPTTSTLGALRHPGETTDRFALSEVIGRRNERAGRLLADGVEWGGR